MSKQDYQAKTNAEKAKFDQHRKPASEPSSTEESVNDSEQQSSSEPVSEQQSSTSGNQNLKNDFKAFISDTNTEDTLLDFKKDIDNQLLKIAEQAVNELVSSYKAISPERQKLFLDKIGAVLKQKHERNTSQEQPEKQKDPYGYKAIKIDGVDYKVAKFINTETKTIWKSGNPTAPWLKDLSSEARLKQFGTVEKLQEKPELLDEFALIPKAVYVKQADGKYVPYRGKQPVDAKPTVEE